MRLGSAECRVLRSERRSLERAVCVKLRILLILWYPLSDAPEMSTDHAVSPSTVAAIMTRHVITVNLDHTLRIVRQLFDLHRIHHLPVLEHGKLVGILSDRDLLKAISPSISSPAASARDLATLDKHVHQVMKRSVVTVTAQTEIAEAGQIMLAQSISALPVLDENDHCIGIVTSRDFMKWCLQSGCPAAKAA